MEARGAVRLELPVTKLATPPPLPARDAAKVQRWAERSWELTPAAWVNQHPTPLTLACVLEARLLHVRTGRLRAFNLETDPDRVSLEELAALAWRHKRHERSGVRARGSRSVMHGVPAVVDRSGRR
jgi:hypothetical protein